MTYERASAIVTAVERQHKNFCRLSLSVANEIATVRYQWFDRPEPRTVSGWFAAAGAIPLLTGRMLVEDDAPVDYGVICFTEAA